MKFLISTVISLCVAPLAAFAQLSTQWAEQVSANNVWQEYPRPAMEREEWKNLNGEWEYAITKKGDAAPAKFDGKILVPFAIESALSGVGKMVGADNELWYRRYFTLPRAWSGKNIMLNFDAVDWEATVWVNGIMVGSHRGGYSPFALDITPALRKGENEILVRVYDPTDAGSQPRGKQVANPRSIWYTPVTGIWQTVWLEPVDKSHIKRLHITPDVDSKRLNVTAFATEPGIVEVTVFDGDTPVATATSTSDTPFEIQMPADMKLWDTENPHLYDLTVSLRSDGKTVDKVKSYAAMRKIGMKRDKSGVMRFTLNDKFIFQFGPLDQGWWPDGLYTPPTYDALKYDIDKTKELGFNMIRKHIKVELALWYNYCDRNGMLVWQDMPSGEHSKFSWQMHNYYKGEERKRSPEGEASYRTEWEEIMDNLHNYPCIVTWIPFNEGWGQFSTVEIAEWTKKHDPSRLVNPASGGNFFDCGDILDVHNYPHPRVYLLHYDKANVIGEYGGIACPMEGHLWSPDKNWGYIKFSTPEAVTDEYVRYADILHNLAGAAYTGAVYTQTTDVEIEVNGLMTYDRKLMKVDTGRVRDANQRIIRDFSGESFTKH